MPDLFDPGEITRSQKVDCIRREIKMRERVYPGWIERGRMTPAKADHEIKVMQAILKDYEG